MKKIIINFKCHEKGIILTSENRIMRSGLKLFKVFFEV